MPRFALLMAAAMSRDRRKFGRISTTRFVQPHNAITLSCKSRPPCRPPGSGAPAAATNNKVAGGNCSRRDAGLQFGAAQGGAAAEPRLGGFCQLVRAVGPRHGLLSLSRNFQPCNEPKTSITR